MSTSPDALQGEQDLDRLLAGMEPALDPVRYAYCRMAEGVRVERLKALGIFHEREGITLIMEHGEALRAGLAPDFVARRIELTIHSDLNAVGFLARVAAELAAADIPCNPVSATWHDHLYVPEAMADRALSVLQALQAEARTPSVPAMYAVTVRIDRGVAEEWLAWMRAVHIPGVMATGCFRRCTVLREPDSEPGRIAYRLEYLARSSEALERYQRQDAPALQQVHAERYAGRFEAARVVQAWETEVIAPLA